jgi:NitT/TauT family transport system ATP-binding protein
VSARIAISRLAKAYATAPAAPALPVLANLSLTVAEQEFVCLLGPSGCGKSTLLNILAGLDDEYEGEVAIGGRSLRGRDRPRIGYLFQEPRLLPWLTVERNVAFALGACRIRAAHWPDLIARHLTLTGLWDFRAYYPHQLSGGMRQRVALARALAVEPDLLLMDEPFSGLDEMTARKMRLDLLALWAATRKTILFVTHNAYEATFLGDRILIMTRRPARVEEEIPVKIARPRDYDDPAVFDLNRQVVRAYLETVGE